MVIRSFLISRRSPEEVVLQGGSERAKAVLLLLRRKGPPLSSKQLDYCNEACIGRFLKAKGNHVKKAANQLRATLAWRASLDIDYLTADEFTAELAWGNAYVAGQDEEGRPVVIVRLKPENMASQAQKQFIHYFVFTMEVAISCMSSTVEQCILIVDAAGCHKKGSALGFSTLVQLLKVLGEHYPERLARSFIVDAPATLYYLWKGMSKVLDLKIREKPMFVFSKKYNTAGAPRAASAAASHLMRAAWSYSGRNLWAGDKQLNPQQEEDDVYEDKFEFKTPRMQRPAVAFFSSKDASTCTSSSSSSSSASLSSCSSFSHHLNDGPTLLSNKSHARSFSFASVPTCKKEMATEFRSFRGDTHPERQLNEDGVSRRWADLTFGLAGTDDFVQNHYQNHEELVHKDKSHTLFKPYYNFLTHTYKEAVYRTSMKPPLAGLIAIISPDLKYRQPSFSLHSTAMEAMLQHLHFD